ncbi:hypothetical protein [Bacillus sp. AK128]
MTDEKLSKLRKSMNQTVLKEGDMSAQEKNVLLSKVVSHRKNQKLGEIILSIIIYFSFFSLITGIFIYSVNQANPSNHTLFSFMKLENERGVEIMLNQSLFIMTVGLIIIGSIMVLLIKKRKGTKKLLWALAATAVTVIVVNIQPPQDQNTKTASIVIKESDVKATEEEELTLERKLQIGIHKKLGIKNNIDVLRISNLIVSENEEDVQVNLSSDASEDMEKVKEGIWINSEIAIKEIFQHKEVKSALINWEITTYDQVEQKQKQEVVVSYLLTVEDYNEIDWNIFSENHIKDIASSYETFSYFANE